MSYHADETSTSNAQPIELYLFTYNSLNFLYTSSQYSQSYVIDNIGYTFVPEYIERGQSLKLGDSGGTIETCTITVLRTNSVALLYQGAPPELSAVRVQIFRVHGENNNDYIRILDGVVSQVIFRESYAELTITIENVLNRFIPRGTLSYHCQNCIYDEKCFLNKDDYAFTCYVDGGINGLTISSTNLLEKPEGYFTDGYLKMGNSVRAVVAHKDRYVQIKYPINRSEWSGSFVIYPGCSQLFSICAKRFGNTDNFNGIPYCQPYDAFKHPVDKGAYWIDDEVILRDSRMAIYQMNLG